MFEMADVKPDGWRGWLVPTPRLRHFSYITTREEREQREQRGHPMKLFTVETIYRLRPILAEQMGTSQQPSYQIRVLAAC